MDESRRKQIYSNLSLRETEDLIEIWQEKNTEEWDEEVFDIIQEILLQRLGELPSQSTQVLSGEKLNRINLEPTDHVPLQSTQAQVREIVNKINSDLQAGELTEALNDCEYLIQLAPDHAMAYTYRGLIYDEMGRVEDALANYQTAVRLDPELQDAWFYLEVAEEEMEDAFQDSPSKHHLDRALEYIYNDETEWALAECKLGQENISDIPTAYNDLGMLFEELGQLEPAEGAYLKAIHLNARYHPARGNLARVRRKLEEELYRQAPIETVPDFEIDPEWEGSKDEDPVPGWVYMDEKAYLLPGWPGYRTRPGRSGYDPIDYQIESAHMEGVMIRLLLTRKFRTHNPIYLFIMSYVGILYCLPLLFIGAALLSGEWMLILPSLLYSPAGIVGVAVLGNIYLSFQTEKTDEAIENGYEFF